MTNINTSLLYRTILLSVTLLFILMFPEQEVIAEGVYMHDGRVIYGRIISQNDNIIQLRTNYGIIKLKKNDIKKIDYDLGLGIVTVTMKNGSFINGTLISFTATRVVVKDENIEHDISRSDIESLVLHKFEGSRDNIFGLTGGIIITTNSLHEQTPYGYIDITAFYLRNVASFPVFQWGLSASYIKLKTIDKNTNLEDAELTFSPLLVDLRLKYPLLTFVSSSDWATGVSFFVNGGVGMSHVTLREGNDSRNDFYYTFQPGMGLSINIGEKFYLVNQYDYLYIHQQELSYTGFRVRLGAGYIF